MLREPRTYLHLNVTWAMKRSARGKLRRPKTLYSVLLLITLVVVIMYVIAERSANSSVTSSSIWIFNKARDSMETFSLEARNGAEIDKRGEERKKKGTEKSRHRNDSFHQDEIQTSDNWPVFSRNFYPKPIPRSPFTPDFTITWDYNTTEFLQRPDVKGQPPKIITWMVKTRYLPPLPEPVRLRVCPEMPCLMTTNKRYQNQSAALMWAAQIMRDPAPPKRSHPDQIFVHHNHEPQDPSWIMKPSFRNPAWKSAFNWTMNYRFDSDIVDLYGLAAKRRTVPAKNYTDILAKKKKFAFWLASHCPTHGRREDYVKLLQRHVAVDAYGSCGAFKCPRSADDTCFRLIDTEYKFFLAFENALCKDYITEKLFRYLQANVVVVARGSNDYKHHIPPGIFVNTADFRSVKDLADYLLYLDTHPDEYIKILKAKDEFQFLYEDYPIRDNNGSVVFMTYHYKAVAMCEMCRRLWNLDTYKKNIPDIVQWFDKENCYPPKDLN